VNSIYQEGEILDEELYNRIRKKNRKTYSELYKDNLKRSWFLCYNLTQNVCTAAPLLISAWESVINEIMDAEHVPDDDFQTMLSESMLRHSLTEVKADRDYQGVHAPAVASRYKSFVRELMILPDEYRAVYLMNTYGELSKSKIAEIYGVTDDEIQNRLKSASDLISEKTKSETNLDYALEVKLRSDFKSSTGEGFANIEIPSFLQMTLEHTLDVKNATSLSKPVRDKGKNAANGDKNRINKQKTNEGIWSRWKKLIISGTIIVIIVIFCFIFIPKIISLNTVNAASTTTYKVETVTYGNVDSTISGSGTLTPISKQTLTISHAAEVTAVNYSVGDTVSSGAVIATVSSEKAEVKI
jgi:DNA-directed RNA polymerase specialized sigma24 family protein